MTADRIDEWMAKNASPSTRARWRTAQGVPFEKLPRDERAAWQAELDELCAEEASYGAGSTNGSRREQVDDDDGPASFSNLIERDLGAALTGERGDQPATILVRGDGLGLIYAAKVNVIHSEPSLGKTWVLLHAAVEVLDAGGTVVVLDWEDSAATTANRLAALGVDPKTIGDPTRVRYFNPAGPLADLEVDELVEAVRTIGATVLTIDAMSSALVVDGADENSNSDVTGWHNRICRPVTATGAAVIIADHVIKNPAERSRGARGAGAKLAVIDGAAYELKAEKPFARNRPGTARLVIAKDRPGQVGPINTTAATVHFTPGDDGRLTIELRVPESSIDDAGNFRPTVLMERMSRALEARGEPATREEALGMCTGKNDAVRTALRRLIDEGYVEVSRAGRARLHRSIRPFRDVDQLTTPAPTTAPPFPDDPGPDPGPGNLA
jgi:AAA domain